MILAIDVGNTNLVLALGDGSGSVDAVWRIRSDAVTSGDACADAIRETLRGRVADIDDTVIASVVPKITPHVAAAMQAITGRAPLIVGGPDVDLGIEINIDNPGSGRCRPRCQCGRRAGPSSVAGRDSRFRDSDDA